MNFNYERAVAAPVVTVWAALTDPDAMESHLPGTTKVTSTGFEQIRVSMKIKMGFLRPTVNVDVKLSRVLPTDSFKFEFGGKSMGAGVDGSADVKIDDDGSVARVYMIGSVETTGMLKKIPDSKIQTAASEFLDDYFSSVERTPD